MNKGNLSCQEIEFVLERFSRIGEIDLKLLRASLERINQSTNVYILRSFYQSLFFTRSLPIKSERRPGERLKIVFATAIFPSVRHGGGLRLFDLIIDLSKEHDVFLFSIYSNNSDIDSLRALEGAGVRVNITDDTNFTPETLLSLIRNQLGYVEQEQIDVLQLEFPDSLRFLYDERLRWHSKMISYTLMESVSRRCYIDLKNLYAGGYSAKEFDLAFLEFLREGQREAEASKYCDLNIFVTAHDREFNEVFFGANTRSEVVPTWLSSSQIEMIESSVDKNSVLFLASFQHQPNIDGVRWYLKNIHAEVQKTHPDYRLILVGNGPIFEAVKGFEDMEGIEVVGWVDKISPWIAKAKVCISPIVSGAGIRGKVIQYTAFGRPVVSTKLGAEGLEELEKCSNFRVASNVSEFIDGVVSFLSAPDEPGDALVLSRVTQKLFGLSAGKEKILNAYRTGLY
ncbi:glycosyltransferase [Bdellovibrio bacteriovorus]|uniref:glycosyltransferase n=1 Tax=Bdellovibrio bacteriovorus TaxID=959 RepID=UPI0035A70654